MRPLILSAVRLATAIILAAAIPAAAQMATMVQFLDSTMGLMTPAGMMAPSLSIRTIDSANMPVANATVHFTYSPACGPAAMPVDVMTNSMGMAMTPSFMTGMSTGMCTVTTQLAPAMVQQMYMIDVYGTSDIMLSAMPGMMLSSFTDESFTFTLTATVHGAPLANAPASFSVNASGTANVSMMMPMMAMTDAMGSVMVSVMANSMPGMYMIDANVGGAMAVITVSQSARSMMPPAQPARQASGASPAGTGPVTVSLAAASACTFGASSFVSVKDASIPAPPGVVLPHGLVSLRLDACGIGQSVNVSIDYPQDIPPTAAFWRYGPTAADMTPHWSMVPAAIDSHRLQLTLTDGAAGDDDLMRNGSISVLGGFGMPGGPMQDLWWSGNAENGWGMSIVQHGDALFAVIYAYDSAGRPTWYAMPGGEWNANRTKYTGALYQPRGTPFFQYDASHLSIGNAVGTATLTFSDASNAVLDYSVGGASGRKSIVRQIYGARDMSDHGNHADMWWGGVTQNGWGVALMQQYATLFAVWFTYDASGSPVWFVMSGGTWTSSDTFEGRAYRTTSSPWAGVAYDPARLQVSDVGMFRLRFGGDSPTLDFTVDGRSGTLQLLRQPF